MIKKTITFTDYNGETKTEDHYFHLNKAELIEMKFSVEGGYDKLLDRIIKSKNDKELVSAFKDLICKSYGKKTEDGKFIKSKEILDSFIYSEAYSELFIELSTNEEAGAEFVNGVIPSNLAEEADKIMKNADNEAGQNAAMPAV